VRGLHDDLIEYRTHFRWAAIVVVAAFAVLAFRLFFLQVVEGDRYEALATVSHVVRDRVAPSRGDIRDRNGEVLATDIEVADLTVVPQYVRDLDREIDRLVGLGVLDADEGASIRGLIVDAKAGKKRFQRLVAHRHLVSTRCPHDLVAMTFDGRRGKLVCSRCGRAFIDERAVVQAHLHELPGFSIRTRTVRHYPARQLTAHAVGTVNEVTAAEVERSSGRLRPADTIGRSGVERALDETLRGVPGEDVYVRGAGGQRLAPQDLPDPFRDLTSTPPTRGRDVTLTIDLGLQKAAAAALKSVASGAVVALDAETGEVLAMASAPSFDPEPVPARVGDADAKPADPVYAPQMNKAVSAYACGSTFKVITAIAALMEGLIAEDSETFCPGFYEYRGRKFKCFRRYGHGKMKLVPALAESCDTYFYQLGDFLGLDNLAHWARDVFGLGERTGVELAEDPGLVPTERWYRRHRFGFQPGYAINTAVGQGDVRVTPLAMARAYAAVVNGGRLLRPRLVAATQSPGGGPMVETAPEVQRVIDIPDDYLDVVKAGMYGAVNSEKGTAHTAEIEELPFAGKTGTAQARERRPGASDEVAAWLLQDHAWFVSYAPAKRPKVVVAAFVEHGGFGGAVAAPIVRSVLETYYAEHADEFADLWRGLDDDEKLEIVK
jgi:penicillin-binding protein 2